MGYAWAAVAAVCAAAVVEQAAPRVVPAVLLALLLTLMLAQVPLPRRLEDRCTPRPRRSELHRHLNRRIRDDKN
jgi:hypothetical protein